MDSELQQQLQSTLGAGISLERELGGGGMSRVFVAHETELNRPIVVKVLPPEMAASVAVERFRREIQLSAQLQHPCIVPLLTTGTAFGCPYYTMPFVEGETLKQKLEKSGALPIAECLKILRDIASALAYAHARGIVHRDLKPANVLISGGYALVMDFGIAKALSDSVLSANAGEATTQGMALGTPAYMAPEQVAGDPDLDHRADLYAWGIVAYETLAGKPPFTGVSAQKLLAAQIVETPKPLNQRRHDVPALLATIVMRCLAKEPGARIQNADDIVKTLDLVPSGGETPQLEKPASQSAAIAVLPFVNMSTDQENEYFSDGMTDEIINVLSHMRRVRVASRMSSFAFKGKELDLKTVATKLNVDSVLIGSVRKSGSRLRISAQLVNAADGYHLWSEHFDRQFADVFDIQDEIAAAIAKALEATLLGVDTSSKKRPTENLDAYELYLKGRYYWNQRGEGLRRGLEYFQLALKLDPDYPLALVGVADSLSLLGWYEVLSPAESFAKAKVAILRALSLDDSLAEAHSTYGFISMCYDWDWACARREFHRAIELDPIYPHARTWLGALHLAFRRYNEGIGECRRAIEIDPLSVNAHLMVSWLLVVGRRYEEAIEEIAKATELNPHLYLANQLLGLAWFGLGDADKAAVAFTHALALGARQPWTVASLAYVFGKTGRVAEAHELTRELLDRSTRQFVPKAKLAIAYAATGDTDQVLDCIEAAHRDRESWILSLLVETAFDDVRSHPRFVRVLEAVGLI